MKKKSNLFFSLIAGLFLIGFVNAYNGYGSFSLGDFLNNLDSSNVILIGVFLISFAVLNMALLKFFKDPSGEPNKTVAGIVAFVISVFIIYGLNRTGLDMEGIFFTIGISPDLLYPIVTTILIAGIFFLSWKYTLPNVLMIVGGFMMLGSFFIYEGASMLIFGLILFLIGAIWKWKGKKKRENLNWARGASTVGKGMWQGAKAGANLAKSGAQFAKDKYKARQAEAFKEERIKEEEKERARREQARQEDAERAKEEERQKEDVKQKREQIGADLKSMKNSYVKLRKEYDKIFSEDKNNPRLGPLVKQMTGLMDAIKKLRKQK